MIKNFYNISISFNNYKKLDLKLTALLCLALSLIGVVNTLFKFQTANGFKTTHFETAHYTSIFIIGALLAKHRGKLITLFKNLSLKSKYILLIFSFILNNYLELGYYKILAPIIGWKYDYFIYEYDMALGASGFIIISLGSGKISRLFL